MAKIILNLERNSPEAKALLQQLKVVTEQHASAKRNANPIEAVVNTGIDGLVWLSGRLVDVTADFLKQRWSAWHLTKLRQATPTM